MRASPAVVLPRRVRLARADSRLRRSADPRAPVFVAPCEASRGVVRVRASPGAGDSSAGDACAGFARARGPLRRALAAVAGRFVAGRGWERLGYARLGDHARERLGLAARTLQDLARVDAELERLPSVEAALVGGSLPWSKVRLLCRVAVPGDAARWVALARRLSLRQLEREVRAVDAGSLEAGAAIPATDEDGAPLEPRGSLQIRCSVRVNGKWWYARQLARRSAGEALPPWQAMEAVAAELLSAFPLEGEHELDRVPELDAEPEHAGVEGGAAIFRAGSEKRSISCERARGGFGDEAGTIAPAESLALAETRVLPETLVMAETVVPPETLARVETIAAEESLVLHRSCAAQTPGVNAATEGSARAAHSLAAELPAELPAELRSLVDSLDSADAFELDARLRRAIALEQCLEAELGALLLRMSRGRRYLSRGVRSLEEYAREVLGISPRKARGILRLARVAEHRPELLGAWRAGRLSWAQAQVLLPAIAGAGAAESERWIAHAEQVTLRRLEDDVDLALCALSSATAPELAGSASTRSSDIHATGTAGARVDHDALRRAIEPSSETHAAAGPFQDAACCSGFDRRVPGDAEPAGAGPFQDTAWRAGFDPRPSGDAEPAGRQTGAQHTDFDRPEAPGRRAGFDPRTSSDAEPAGRQSGAQRTDFDRREAPGRVFWTGPVDSLRFFRAALCSLRRRVERATGRMPSEEEAFEAMLDHAIDAWGGHQTRVPRKWRVFERDGWRCAVPGCSSYRNLQDHHIQFRGAGGSNALENRITLCAWHHLRGVHAGRLRISGRAPGALRFELGLRTGRASLVAYRSGDVLETQLESQLEQGLNA